MSETNPTNTELRSIDGSPLDLPANCPELRTLINAGEKIVAVMQPDAAKVRFVAQENAKAMTIACSFMSCCVGWLVAPCLYTTLKSSHIANAKHHVFIVTDKSIYMYVNPHKSGPCCGNQVQGFTLDLPLDEITDVTVGVPLPNALLKEPAQLRVELNHRGINMLRWPVDAKGLQKLIRSMAKNCSSGEVTATQPQRSEDAPATAVAATVDGKPVGAMVAVKVDLV